MTKALTKGNEETGIEKAKIGDLEVIVKRDANGDVKAVKGKVTLDMARKEIYGIPGSDPKTGKWGKVYNISADGYIALNQIANLSMIEPDHFRLENGDKVPNPHIETENGFIVAVHVKKRAFGYGPLGNPCITDASVSFNLKMYFLQDIINKIKSFPDAGKIIMEAGVTQEMRETCVILNYNYGIVVVADVAHPEIRKVIGTQVQREKFAERIASKIAIRNALKVHPAIAAQTVEVQDGRATVTVFGLRHGHSQSEMVKIADSARVESEGFTQIESSSDMGENDMDTIDAQAEYVKAETDVKAEKTQAYEDAGIQEPPEPEPTNDDEQPTPDELFASADTVTAMKGIIYEVYGKDAVEAMSDAGSSPGPHDDTWKDLNKTEKKAVLENLFAKLGKAGK